jgi:hypothetical protein
VAITLNSLGVLYKQRSRFAEAEKCFTRAYAICCKRLGPTHPGVSATLTNYAAMHRARAMHTKDHSGTRGLPLRPVAPMFDLDLRFADRKDSKAIASIRADFEAAEEKYKKALEITKVCFSVR